MKKILSLLALVLMSCMGAWAFEAGTYTIKPYSDQTKYLVPSSVWFRSSDNTVKGPDKVTYTTNDPTSENGGHWTIANATGTESGYFTLSPENARFVDSAGNHGYLNPWNGSGNVGCWTTTDGADRWNITLVEGFENVYKVESKEKEGYYFYYNSENDYLEYNNPGTLSEAYYFVIEKVAAAPTSFPGAGTHYLTFKGKDSGRPQYLYHDLTQADGYTLASSTQGTTNAFIWRAECDGTKMTNLKNGQGQTIGMYGKHSDGNFYTNALTYTAHSDCYYLFPQGATGMKSTHNCLNQSNSSSYANSQSTKTLTSWSTTANGGADANDNHWYVTEVTDKDFYDVVITDGVAADGFNYSVASYANYDGQHAANGGFFAVAKGTTITDNDVTVTNTPSGKVAVVEVNDHTINITFETPANSINVTYTFTIGGETIGSVERLETEGAAPTITDIIPSYVNVVSGMPTNVIEAAYTIETSYTGLPFEVGEKCYQLKFANGDYYIFANNSYTNAKEANSFSENRDFKWQMGGNWFTGFTFRNLSGYYMAAPNKNPGNSVNTTVPTTLTDLCYFDVEENGTNGFRFKPHGGSNYLAHTSWTGLNVQFYNYAVGNTAMQITFTEKERISATEIEELQNKINNVLANITAKKVGYPFYGLDYETPQANIDAVNAIFHYMAEELVNATNYDKALSDLNAVYALTDVNLPMPGKAYTIAFRKSNGALKYIAEGGDNMFVDNKADAAVFVAGTTDDATYNLIFVDKAGEYLRYHGASTTQYQQYGADFKCGAMVSATQAHMSNAYKSAEYLFGTVYLTANSRNSASNGNDGCLILQESNNQGNNSAEPFLDGTYTSALVIEDAEFPYTTKTLNAGGDDNNYATVALPYAMVIPEGVTAYAATAEGEVLTLTEATSPVPAGAYILVSENAASATILPAAANPAAVDNELQGSITTAPSGDIYVLNKVDGVGFYKFNGGDYSSLLGKAYLPSSAKANKLSFRYDDIITAISAIESNNSGAEIFDLQGRRLNKAQKGMNIINGHKVLVK